MESFQETCASLESLQTFDPSAFVGDKKVPQKLCNLVLALASIYNDCKNITYASFLLGDSKPTGMPELNGTWGTWSGINMHIFRLMVSAVHELFVLLQKHEDVLAHDFLVKIVKQLPPDSRRSWKSLTATAVGATPKDEFGRMLLGIRNQTAFHYDPKGIFRGFERWFLVPTRLHDRAFISRGRSMRESRFYFADAAVQGFCRELAREDDLSQLSMKIRENVEALNVALLNLVDCFIQHRGFAYRAP